MRIAERDTQPLVQVKILGPHRPFYRMPYQVFVDSHFMHYIDREALAVRCLLTAPASIQYCFPSSS